MVIRLKGTTITRTVANNGSNIPDGWVKHNTRDESIRENMKND